MAFFSAGNVLLKSHDGAKSLRCRRSPADCGRLLGLAIQLASRATFCFIALKGQLAKTDKSHELTAGTNWWP
jgi:hypothetical protein